ncbi:hypothetical protein HU200_034144 [Digitaria exilis]|uniref:Amidase domain-containing protein n=1 Tax=Digitaria exilis TaxID=1010633 RepID=A0A835EK82_9POAL|nr:hypothetical protein HU200_034144 [Digitaria exilis]
MEGRPLRWEPPSGIGARGLCRPPDPNPDPSRTTEGVEHISRLPDDLLLQVLVRLQCTRAAAHTSLISRCWRGLWRYLPELYFRDITPGALDTALSQVARGQLCLLDIDVPDEHRYSAAGVASLLRTAALLAPVVLSVSVCGDISDRDISVEVPIFERATSIKPNVWNLYLVPPAKGGEFTVLEKLSISANEHRQGGYDIKCGDESVVVDDMRIEHWLGNVDTLADIMVGLQQQVLAVVVVALAAAGCGAFQFEDATVDAIQLGFSNGSLTSTALVKFYLDQIARLNPLLHAVIEVNPDALAQAARADAERSASSGRCAGGLHGVPVLLKDNIATRDRLNTTAGSLALLGSVVPRDAGVVARLRRAGAVILGKANPSEWSNFRPVAAGWSARGGQTMNPYVLSVTPCGSSAGPGVAAAANMAAVTLGSETDGSILCPSSWNSVVGIKPTVGLTSRSGVIPITPRQDTIGPMCRTVSDAVHVLDAIVGYDELDAQATGAASKYIPHGGYTQFLKVDGLRGKRIGLSYVLFQGFDNDHLAVYEKHLNTMSEHGAIVVDDLDIATNFSDLGDKETLLMEAEFKLSLNAYLSDLLRSPVRTLSDVIAFNNAHPVEERLRDFGQPDLIAAEKTNGIGAKERAALRRLHEISTNGLERMMKEHQLDAIVAPNHNAGGVLAIGGHPGIAVPAGYDKQGIPFGICFGGLRGYEPRLIEIAYAFEQATRVRRPPTFKR